jgi:MoaA/NifB/PqqE/SkfB family radical SAM enzyme
MKQSSRVSIAPDVFSRVEDSDKLLLVRPGGASSPVVRLLRAPARDLWHALAAGGSVEALVASVEGPPECPDAAYRILSLLKADGFITGDLPGETVGRSADANGLSLDPWAYQFSSPCLDRPWFALWELTDRCPRKQDCAFCYRPKPGMDPTVEECARIVDQITRERVPFVTLLGGEPLCHPEVFAVIAALRARAVFVKLITSGALVDEAVAEKLAHAGLNQVAVSLDGLTPEVNDRSRGAGSFDFAVAAVRTLQRHLPRVSLSLTVSGDSLPQVDALPGFCRDLAVDEVYISPLRPVAEVRAPASGRPLTAEETARLQESIAACNAAGLKVIGLRECSCGRSSCVIHPDGRVSPCPFAARDFGNVHDEDLAVLWTRMNAEARRIGPVRASSACFRRFENRPAVTP